MKVVIVGGGAGGISTASNIRKIDKDCEIVVLTRDNKVAYSPCAIPYDLSGTIESFDDIVMRHRKIIKREILILLLKLKSQLLIVIKKQLLIHKMIILRQ